MKLISKDTVITEIEKLQDWCEIHNQHSTIDLLEKLFDRIDILEGKEVDLEKEINSQWKNCAPVDEGMGYEFANICIEQFANIAKYFFELGLNIQKGE